MSRKIIHKLFRYATQSGADHLVISNEGRQVSFDCHLPNGTMRSLNLPEKIERDFFSSAQKILEIAPGELFSRRYQQTDNGRESWKYYLTVLPDGKNEKIIISLVGSRPKAWRVSQLGLQRKDRQEIEKIGRLRSGLVVISSPERQGRSATLNAVSGLLNQNKATYFLGAEAEAGNFHCLASTRTNWEKILRLDSDIILTDDLSSDWKISEAFRAANSGRLVIATMIGGSALDVLHKLLKSNLPARLKTENLKLIINQRLVDLKAERIRRGKTSASVPRGKIGLFEVLRLTPEIKSFIVSSKEHDLHSQSFERKLEKLAGLSGFHEIAIDRKLKIKDGLI